MVAVRHPLHADLAGQLVPLDLRAVAHRVAFALEDQRGSAEYLEVSSA
jgi:hypothetical protein